MSGRMPLEPPRSAEPGWPGGRGGLRGLAAQTGDHLVALVQVAAQHLDALVVADPGLHLDPPERAVGPEEVDGALLLVGTGRRLSLGAEAQRAHREAEDLVALRGRDRDVGRHAGPQLELRVVAPN